MSKTNIESRFIGTSDIAADLGITSQTVRNLIARGELHAVRIGSILRVDRQSFHDYLRRVGADVD